MGAETQVTIDILGDASNFEKAVADIASSMRAVESTTRQTTAGVAVFTGQVAKLENGVGALNSTLKTASVLLPGMQLPSQKTAEDELKTVNAELSDMLKNEKAAYLALQQRVKAQEQSAAAAKKASNEKHQAEQQALRDDNALKASRASLEQEIQKHTKIAYNRADSEADLRKRAMNEQTKRTRSAAGVSDEEGGGHGGHGGLLFGNTRAIGDILDVLTGTQGWGMKANIVAHFARAIPPLALAFGGLESARAAFDSTKTTNELLNLSGESTGALPFAGLIPKSLRSADSFGTAGRADAGSISEMEKRRAELEEGVTKTQKSRGFFSAVGNSMFFGGNGNERSFSAETKAKEKSLYYDEQIADKIREQTAARAMSVSASAADGELAKLRLETEEKVATLRDRAAKNEIGVQQYHSALTDVRAQAAEEEQAINNRKRGREIEIELQNQLTEARRAGDGEAVASAHAQLTAAVGRLEIAKDRGEESGIAAALAELNAASQSAEMAEKQHRILLANQAAETEIANIRASSDQTRLASLISEKRLIEEEQSNPRTLPDRQRELSVKSAQNAQAIAAEVSNQTNRAFDIGMATVDANTGRGQGSQMDALRQKIAIQQGRVTNTENNPMASPEDLASQRAQLQGMQNQLADMEENRAAGLASSAAQTDSLGAELNKQTELAGVIRQQASYTEQIRQAQRDGNTALVTQLQNQQQISEELAVQNANPWRREALKQELQLRKEKEQQLDIAKNADAAGKPGTAAAARGKAAAIQSQIDAVKAGVEPVADSLAAIGGGGNVYGLGGAGTGRERGLHTGGLTSGGLKTGSLGLGSLDELTANVGSGDGSTATAGGNSMATAASLGVLQGMHYLLASINTKLDPRNGNGGGLANLTVRKG